ncbi:g1685 [Coccomyxa viridis]|uniref:G1685 protein n=1 Tax=Coccomyxa viridis TaxID=1274662 RepID=A0ABP1FME6_9CHLO
MRKVQVSYDAMPEKESSRPGLSVLTVSLETYHEQIKAAKQSQTLLLGTIDDILTGLEKVKDLSSSCGGGKTAASQDES